MQLTFRSLSEEHPGDAWRRVVSHGWPGWSEWFLARGGHTQRIEDARRALRRHMPEYESLWDDLNLAGGADDDLVRFLSFWCPPRYLVNCSQAVIVDQDGPYLIRNYDLDPDLNEATFLSTAWRGTRVAGMVEAMAGLSDGMNEFGLAASLTFGGRVVTSKGFGIPLIMRYVLQMCRDIPEAIEALRSVPSHMSYNVTLVDKSGDWATVFLAPDRPAIVRMQPWATNHQLGVEWPRHGRVSNTLGRAEHIATLLGTSNVTSRDLDAAFHSAPIYSTNYAQGFGTVYTAAYRPTQGTARLSWRDGTSQEWAISNVTPWQQAIAYTSDGAHALPSPDVDPSEPHPEWYANFLRSLPHDADDADGLRRARLAAFWRRNHLGEDREWSNLSPCTPIIEEE